MLENKSSRWNVGVHFVQWQINISEHETIKTSPFKVMFGIEPKVGLASTVIPINMLGNIRTEEDLDTILQNEFYIILFDSCFILPIVYNRQNAVACF